MASRRASCLYFAYGSNMNESQMHARVPGSRKVSVGFLPGHEFIYSGYSETWGGAVANVRPKRGSEVFGVLYELPADGLSRIDRFEGYPTAYQRKTVTIEDGQGARRRAVLYFKRATKALAPPSPSYVETIRAALARLGV